MCVEGDLVPLLITCEYTNADCILGASRCLHRTHTSFTQHWLESRLGEHHRLARTSGSAAVSATLIPLNLSPDLPLQTNLPSLVVVTPLCARTLTCWLLWHSASLDLQLNYAFIYDMKKQSKQKMHLCTWAASLTVLHNWQRDEAMQLVHFNSFCIIIITIACLPSPDTICWSIA